MKQLFSILLFTSFYMNVQSQSALQTVAEFGKYQPIGVAVTATNRIFITFPRHLPYEYGVAELVNGKKIPYPDAEWNVYDSLHPENHFINAQAAVTDDKNNLWVLDPANPVDGATIAEGVKLLKINLSTNSIEHIYRFEDLPRSEGALNDVRVDTRRNLAYLSDPKLAAIVVLDLATGKSRLVLQKDKSVIADTGFNLNLDGKDVIDEKGKPFSSNINGIALTHNGVYFYYRAINQTKLYRIKTEYLSDSSMSDSVLSSHVETVAVTGVSHGMIADNSGNIYLTDSPDKAIKYVTKNGEVKTLVTDERLIWPDTFALNADGFLYLTCSQLNREPKFNNGTDKTEYPYRLYKIKLP